MRRIALFVTLSIGLAPATADLRARQAEPLVLVDAAVVRADGQLETGLTQESFEILTAGGLQPIRFFSAGDRALALVLLVDVTASMKVTIHLDDVKAAAERFFVNRLGPSDRARIGAIAKDLFLGPQFTSDRRQLLVALRKAFDPDEENTLGPSPIWDAVYDGITALSTADGRRAVVLLTDGLATGNRRSPEEVAGLAARANVSINSVGLDRDMTLVQGGDTAARIRPGAAQRWLAEVTGGQYVPVSRGTRHPGPSLERILADLRRSYTLGFEPPPGDGSLQKLEVRVKTPGLKVRSRMVYFSAKGSVVPHGPTWTHHEHEDHDDHEDNMVMTSWSSFLRGHRVIRRIAFLNLSND